MTKKVNKKVLILGRSSAIAKDIATFEESLDNDVIPFGMKDGFSLEEGMTSTVRRFLSKEPEVIYFCAWDQNCATADESYRKNVLGMKSILDGISNEVMSSAVFISSMSADLCARSFYGRHKALIEDYMLRRGGAVIRLGVYISDGDQSGIFSKLVKICDRYSMVPIPAPNARFFISNTWVLNRDLRKIRKGEAIFLHSVEVETKTFFELMKLAKFFSERTPFLLPLSFVPAKLVFNSATFHIASFLGFNIDSFHGLMRNIHSVKRLLKESKG